MQTRKPASVLPEPVGAAISVCCPAAMAGQPSRCGRGRTVGEPAPEPLRHRGVEARRARGRGAGGRAPRCRRCAARAGRRCRAGEAAGKPSRSFCPRGVTPILPDPPQVHEPASKYANYWRSSTPVGCQVESAGDAVGGAGGGLLHAAPDGDGVLPRERPGRRRHVRVVGMGEDDRTVAQLVVERGGHVVGRGRVDQAVAGAVERVGRVGPAAQVGVEGGLEREVVLRRGGPDEDGDGVDAALGPARPTASPRGSTGRPWRRCRSRS